MQKQATITSKGQVTVPREVRRLLGVRAGDRLLFESDDSGIRVRRAQSDSSFFKYRGIGNPRIGSGKKNITRWLRDLRGK
jgi:antitoxin PrlF